MTANELPATVPPPGWGGDSLSHFFQLATNNSWASYTNELTRPWFDKLLAIDQAFVTGVDLMSGPAPNFIEGLMLVNAHAAYRAAAELALQTRTCEAYVLMRSSIEYAMYAVHFFRKPELFEVWAKRGDGQAERKAVRKAFKPVEMIAGVAALHDAIGERVQRNYDLTIDMGAHPNEIGFFGRLKIDEVAPGSKRLAVQYLHGNPLAYLSTMKAAAQVGICTLECFWLIYRERFEIMGLKATIDGLKNGL